MYLLNFSRISGFFITAVFGLTVGAGLGVADTKAGLEALSSKDYQKAVEEFSTAFEAGEADAAFYLGRMLELGIGGQPNLKAAVGLYIAGSVKNSAAAKNRLGVLHVQGKGVLQNYEEGAKLICEAAELGDLNATFNCGSLLQDGKGLEKNEVKAIEWFKAASQKGHFGAMNFYAAALLEGKFAGRDVEKAVELYKQTASHGNSIGLFSLGQAFASGLGVKQDLEKAHAYFNIAATLEHPQALEARQLVEKEMTAGQIRNAQQFAKSWRPVNSKQNSETVTQ